MSHQQGSISRNADNHHPREGLFNELKDFQVLKCGIQIHSALLPAGKDVAVVVRGSLWSGLFSRAGLRCIFFSGNSSKLILKNKNTSDPLKKHHMWSTSIDATIQDVLQNPSYQTTVGQTGLLVEFSGQSGTPGMPDVLGFA